MATTVQTCLVSIDVWCYVYELLLVVDVPAEDTALGHLLKPPSPEPHGERRWAHHVGPTWGTNDPNGRHAQVPLQKEKVSH